MKTLFDTSVLVAALVQAHPMHDRSLPWLRRARAGEFEFLVASHTLTELYAVLTRLPVRPLVSPGAAWRLVHDNLEGSARIVSLSAGDYANAVKNVAEMGLTGGLVYRALIVRAALKAGAERLLTLSPADLRLVWPEGESVIVVP